MRIYNNYDGYMYTVHKLSLDTTMYLGKEYHLDNEKEADALLFLLEDSDIIFSKVVTIHNYTEKQYKFNKEKLPIEFLDAKLDVIQLQRKPTLLNIKLLLA